MTKEGATKGDITKQQESQSNRWQHLTHIQNNKERSSVNCELARFSHNCSKAWRPRMHVTRMDLQLFWINLAIFILWTLQEMMRFVLMHTYYKFSLHRTILIHGWCFQTHNIVHVNDYLGTFSSHGSSMRFALLKNV